MMLYKHLYQKLFIEHETGGCEKVDSRRKCMSVEKLVIFICVPDSVYDSMLSYLATLDVQGMCLCVTFTGLR